MQTIYLALWDSGSTHCVLVRTHSLAKLVLHAELCIGHLYEEEFICTAVVAVPDIVGKCMMSAALRMRPARVRPKLRRHTRLWMALITTSSRDSRRVAGVTGCNRRSPAAFEIGTYFWVLRK